MNLQSQHDADYECPGCGEMGVYSTEIERQFQYGLEPNMTTLTATVPLRTCKACGAEFFDEEAEQRQHEAICRHLRVMTPAEIRVLRKAACGLSRAEFCEITRIGSATLARWERGDLIQNVAYDQLLYLMRFPDNVVRLAKRQGIKPKRSTYSSFVLPFVTATNTVPATPPPRPSQATWSTRTWSPFEPFGKPQGAPQTGSAFAELQAQEAG